MVPINALMSRYSARMQASIHNQNNNNNVWCKLKKPDPLQPPAKKSDSIVHEPLQQWRAEALNSTDFRDRIAVTGGISRGVFGCLHLGADQTASNDSDYSDKQQCA